MRPLMRLASASACGRPMVASISAVGAPLSFTSLMLSTGAKGLSASLIPSSVTSSGRLPITMRIDRSSGLSCGVAEPGLEQRVAHCQHDRPDEDADQAEADEAADHPGEDEQQRQVGAALDEDRPHAVVDGGGGHSHDQEERAPTRGAPPREANVRPAPHPA